MFDSRNVDESTILVFAQLFGRNAGIFFYFFDEVILVCQILFRKQLAFADLLE